MVKSTDLKRRLFEVGLQNNSAVSAPPILNPIASPKNKMLTKKSTAKMEATDQGSQVLKYKPSNSPTSVKTEGKDFFIRRSPKLALSPKANQTATASGFFPKEDKSVRPKDSKRESMSTLRQQLETRRKEEQDHCIEDKNMESKLDEYVSLVLRGVSRIDEFLYLVRGADDNISELELVNFEVVRQHEGDIGYEYYTVSKKGFCQYVSGKPQNFIEIADWAH